MEYYKCLKCSSTAETEETMTEYDGEDAMITVNKCECGHKMTKYYELVSVEDY